MIKSFPHTFHIPVMGLGYTIDTPVKVAPFGISSVISIIEDNLVEQMRKFYCEKESEAYSRIEDTDIDHRAKRITSYLNLINRIVHRDTEKLKSEPFETGININKYFKMLPEDSEVKAAYLKMMKLQEGSEKKRLQEQLREKIVPGKIDVNIMTKCDRINYSHDGKPLPVEYADAMAALRGFAQSDLTSSVVFSAGMNPRLYSYCESFSDFLPDEKGCLKKKLILKVSDYRSAYIQGKFLAKKGLWVSEFRVESGLNCGGHAFPTDGLLMGPILEEFKEKRKDLADELLTICNSSLAEKGKTIFSELPVQKVTAQGGVGTANEHQFLLEYYNLNSIGWGSPFLLVPEAVNVDEETLDQLSHAKKEDYYLSNASPLGIPFNNFRESSSEKQRVERFEKNRPGSPCYKKYLAFNTEFSSEPICSASREYQNLKLKQLGLENLSPEQLKKETQQIIEKDCLCEGLAASVLVKNSIPVPHHLSAVSVCPGPNLAYFSGKFSLEEMISHIYGRKNILNSLNRPQLFINEINLYLEYLKSEAEKSLKEISAKKVKYFEEFKTNLSNGIQYYKDLVPQIKFETENYLNGFLSGLEAAEEMLSEIKLPIPVSVF